MRTATAFCSFVAGLFIVAACTHNVAGDTGEYADYCACDSTATRQLILSENYLKGRHDDDAFLPDSLYSLSAEENRLLWFRDIESPDTTKFTEYWNDYVPKNYHADNTDFIEFYEDKEGVELAFQFGPGGMMWTYHSFVIKKVNCCYVITRSAFTHARFRYKAYALLTDEDMKKLRNVLAPFETTAIPHEEEYGYHGHFIDNLNQRTFFVDFENSGDAGSQSIEALYHFVDDSIRWNSTYGT